MDAPALIVSLKLAVLTSAGLLLPALWLGRRLAQSRTRWKVLPESLVALPLVMPPTVMGFYLMLAFSADTPLGGVWQRLTGTSLNFSFSGILLASLIVNIPFAVQPIQRAFEALPDHLREAAWCSGLSPWRTFLSIELPLVMPGVVSALALTFAHTLGEFGVILMVGGAIDGETRTLAISIYDHVQAFDESAAGWMSALLLAISFITIAVVYGLSARHRWQAER